MNDVYIARQWLFGARTRPAGADPRSEALRLQRDRPFEIARPFVPFFEARFVRTKAFGSSSGPFFSQGQTLGDATTVAGFTDVSYSNSDNTDVQRGQPRGHPSRQPVSVGPGARHHPGAADRGGQFGREPEHRHGLGTTAAGLAAQAAALRRSRGQLPLLEPPQLSRSRHPRREHHARHLQGGRWRPRRLQHRLALRNLGQLRPARRNQHHRGNVNAQRFLLANDTARNAAGQIVCRSQLDPAYANRVRARPRRRPRPRRDPGRRRRRLRPAQSVRRRQYQQCGQGLSVVHDGRRKSTQFVANGFVTGDTEPASSTCRAARSASRSVANIVARR